MKTSPAKTEAAIAAALTTVLAVLPSLFNMDWTSAAGVYTGIAGIAAIIVQRLNGHQKWDALTAPKAAPVVYSTSSAGTGTSGSARLDAANAAHPFRASIPHALETSEQFVAAAEAEEPGDPDALPDIETSRVPAHHVDGNDALVVKA